MFTAYLYIYIRIKKRNCLRNLKLPFAMVSIERVSYTVSEMPDFDKKRF